MAIGDVLEVRAEDIQAFVENKVNSQNQGNNAPDNQPVRTANTSVNDSGFTVSQSEYIEYLIAKRESSKWEARQQVFWRKIWGFIIWLLKFILSVIILFTLFFGFYFLVWFVQNSLYFHHLSTPVIP